MTIELHSYIGAFRPTDKVRPGFRDRYGTLYVLTHSKPYKKEFVIIQTKNIISDHFKCRQDYVYLCEADNQAARRYNNVPGGKISFSSQLNSLNMNCKFVTGIVPTVTSEQLGLSSDATIPADRVVDSFLVEPANEEDAQLNQIIKSSDKAPMFIKAIQKAQIAQFLQQELQMSDVEVADEKVEDLIEWINLYYESSDAEKADAATAILQEIAPESLEPVDAGVVAEALQSLIENDTLNVATGLPREEEIVDEADVQTAADALQITPVAAQPAVVSAIPAGTLPVKATDLKEIYTDVDHLETAARNLASKVRDVIIGALDEVAGQANSTVAETEEAQINL